jgi:branched-chain amino acid aminotransferase
LRVHREKDAVDLPWLTRALLLGDGVFETLRTYGRRPCLLDAHAKRLLSSAKALLIDHTLTPAKVARRVTEALSRERSREELLVRMILASDGELLVLTEPWKGYPARFYSKGMRLCVSTWRRIPGSSFPSHAKSTSYAQFMLAQREAVVKGIDDALILSSDGAVCETTRSNIFFVSEGIVYTPALECGVFPGITREAVIGLAMRCGHEVVERRVELNELHSSSEVFLTSSLLELAPVMSIDRQIISNGIPGKVYRTLRYNYLRLVK